MGIFKKRSIKSLGKKKSDMPEGLWHKCPDCGAIIHEADMKQRFRVCPKCEHHFKMTSGERIEMLTDPGSFEEIDANLETVDALGFKAYPEKIKNYQKQTGLKDAIICGRAQITQMPVVIAVMDFRFLGASMGSVVGEKVTRAIELATKEERGGHHHQRFRRGPDARRHSEPDADGQDQRSAGTASRSGVPLHFRPDRSRLPGASPPVSQRWETSSWRNRSA